jgi:hypothetical protein
MELNCLRNRSRKAEESRPGPCGRCLWPSKRERTRPFDRAIEVAVDVRPKVAPLFVLLEQEHDEKRPPEIINIPSMFRPIKLPPHAYTKGTLPRALLHSACMFQNAAPARRVVRQRYAVGPSNRMATRTTRRRDDGKCHHKLLHYCRQRQQRQSKMEPPLGSVHAPGHSCPRGPSRLHVG